MKLRLNQELFSLLDHCQGRDLHELVLHEPASQVRAETCPGGKTQAGDVSKSLKLSKSELSRFSLRCIEMLTGLAASDRPNRLAVQANIQKFACKYLAGYVALRSELKSCQVMDGNKGYRVMSEECRIASLQRALSECEDALSGKLSEMAEIMGFSEGLIRKLDDLVVRALDDLVI